MNPEEARFLYHEELKKRKEYKDIKLEKSMEEAMAEFKAWDNRRRYQHRRSNLYPLGKNY